jgi:hypothetical protein
VAGIFSSSLYSDGPPRLLSIGSRGTLFSVGIALGYGLDDRGSRVQFPAGAGNFSLHHRVKSDSGAQPPIQWAPGDLSPGVKRPGRETDHWSYTSISPIRLHGVVLRFRKEEQGQSDCGVNLTTRLHLVPRLKLCGAMPSINSRTSLGTIC